MKYNSPEFKKWLDKLQRKSWQLELIISGFAIYGLFSAYEIIDIYVTKTYISSSTSAILFWFAVKGSWSILTFTLLLHVLLRGLWIGAIGLRYVSGDIDYEKLNYSEKFTIYLKNKVGSFDRYISRLENYCSVLFAVSFLLIFYLLGFFSVLFVINAVGFLFEKISFLPKNIVQAIGRTFVVVFILAAVMVFVDFLGQGFLKKRKWTSNVYFPVYRLFSKMTFSFLYRPLAYNFLDNRFGRRLSFWLLPTYLMVLISTGIYHKDSSYLSVYNNSSSEYADSGNYEDLSTEANQFIGIASIPSKVIQKPYLNVFMPFKKDIEDYILSYNENLTLEKDSRGYTHPLIEGVNVQVNGETIKEAKKSNDLQEYLKTLNRLYQVKIDSISFKTDFITSQNQKKRLGFETYIDIRSLDNGKHLLTIEGPAKKNPYDEASESVRKTLVTIPFWYYPEGKFR